MRTDPALAADERTNLDQFLDYHRETLLQKADGLDAAGLTTRLPTSSLTLAGLLKHLALVEDDWIQVRFLGLPELEPWASAPWDEDRDWEFHTAEHDDPDALRALYRAACERSRAGVAGVPEPGVPVTYATFADGAVEPSPSAGSDRVTTTRSVRSCDELAAGTVNVNGPSTENR